MRDEHNLSPLLPIFVSETEDIENSLKLLQKKKNEECDVATPIRGSQRGVTQ